MNDYKLLDSVESENIDKIREYAKAKNERTLLMRRVKYLDGLLNDNNDLKDSVWTTLEQETKPISDLEDSHLKNIVIYLAQRHSTNSRITKEYKKRFGTLPILPPSSYDDDVDLF